MGGLHQASPEKLALIASTSARMAQLTNERMFTLTFRKSQTLSDFVKALRRSSSALISSVRTHLNGTSSELSALNVNELSRVNTINEQRRHAATHKSEVWVNETIPDGFYQDIKQLSVALNLRYETGLRDCFERSFKALLNRFEACESSISDSVDKNLRD